jgi:hypothetical protein
MRLVFKKVCPRCKRRYPPNFTACLECGATLQDTEREAKKEEIKKYIPLIGKLLIAVVIIAAAVFLVLPQVQHSLPALLGSGSYNKTASEWSVVYYTINQPASDGSLKVTVTKTREGSKSVNNKKFLIVTVTLQNLRSDRPLRVAASDFMLIDANGQLYPSYGIGDKIAQDIGPLSIETHDITYEVPENAGGLKMQYTYIQSADRAAQTIWFLL